MFISIMILGLFVILSGCYKEYDDISVKPILLFRVLNSNGETQRGGIINIYMTKDDFLTKRNSFRSRSKDKNGVCMLKDLEEIAYYFSIEKGNLNNFNDKIRLKTRLYYNEERKVECVIK